jgi:hypothetical protein
LEIDSLREFDLDTQVSVGEVSQTEIFTGSNEASGGTLRDYLGAKDRIVTIEPDGDFEGIAIGSGGESLKGGAVFYPRRSGIWGRATWC